MISFVVAFALLLHVWCWGAGLAALTMPAPWRRFWPVFTFPAGFALQSAVVWVGAYADLPGTNAYAAVSELLPLSLLVVAVVRRGFRRWVDDVARFGLVWLVVAGALLALVLPLAIASRGLTSISLGSCDAADYAAGARVFMEFAHHDRTGFLGLTNVVQVMSADNFYDFWLRLNHFTPSALMALNGSILHCAPHELTSLLTMVVLAATIPVVFWVGRAVFGYTAAASLGIAALYGISPIPWYSVAQVSPAPLLAAQAIAVLTWCGIALWNGRLTWTRGTKFFGVLAVTYDLLLGSYNFILIVCLVPAVAYAGGWVLRTGEWRRLLRWLLILAVPFVACGVFFWARVAGLAERFSLFQTYDFGWKIPALTPEGWLGMVQGGTLEPWHWAGLRWLLAVVMAVAFGAAVVRGAQRGGRRIWVIGSVVVPILIGYAFLEGRGAALGTNASYDAFKLFSVFFPLLLPAFCWWITLRWSSRLLEWIAVAGLAFVVFGFNLIACVMFVVTLSRPPLLVGGELRQVRRVEAMPDVSSVNLLIPDMWSRLWANEFLLRKPQYFASHTYEGRLNTALRGDWDLTAGILHVVPSLAAIRPVTTHYTLVNTRDPHYVRVALGDGWYDEEMLRDGDRWNWAQRDATLRIDNPQDHPVRLRVTLDGRSVDERDIAIERVGGEPAAFVHLGPQRQTLTLASVVVPPGHSLLALRSRQPAVVPAGDARALVACVFGLTFTADTP